MKKAIIIGAAGFIGNATVSEFVENGWSVIAVIRKSTTENLEQWAADGKIDLVKADAADEDNLFTALNEAASGKTIDAVINCAGVTSEVGREERYIAPNYTTAENIAAWCASREDCRLIHLSSIEVYGLGDISAENDGDLPLASGKLGPYPKLKIMAEETVRRLLPESRYVIFRPSYIWGPRDPSLAPRAVAAFDGFGFGPVFGLHKGNNRWPLINIKNLAVAFRLAASDSECLGTIITATDKEQLSVRDVYTRIAGACRPKMDFKIKVLPLWLIVAISALNSWLCKVLDRTKPLYDPTYFSYRMLSSDRDLPSDRYQALLARGGFTPVTLDEGFAELARACPE